MTDSGNGTRPPAGRAPTDMTLPVVEIVGPTVQGEGPAAGHRCALVRLAGCNLRCQACDTTRSWKPDQITWRRMTLTEMTDALLNVPVPVDTVMITGGEPLIHQGTRAFRLLIGSLNAVDIQVQIETNGTIAPNPHLLHLTGGGKTWFVVSPKVCGGLATDPASRRIRPDAIGAFVELTDAAFKIVAAQVGDLDVIDRFVTGHNIDRGRVFIMPEGTDTPSILATLSTLAQPAVDRGYHLSTRLHILTGLS